jgi:hypothetical protein
MLVLAAVYRSQLNRFLPEDAQLTKEDLGALFRRTCDALSENAPNSPVLKMDLDVLLSVQRQLHLS